MLEHFTRTLKVTPTSFKPSLSQNSSKLKEINLTKLIIKRSYAQTSKINVEDIIYIKNMFSILTTILSTNQV